MNLCEKFNESQEKFFAFFIEKNSLSVPFPTTTTTTTTSTTTTENVTTSKPSVSNQSSPSINWSDYFSFPIDKASIPLKDHLKDDSCYTEKIELDNLMKNLSSELVIVSKIKLQDARSNELTKSLEFLSSEILCLKENIQMVYIIIR